MSTREQRLHCPFYRRGEYIITMLIENMCFLVTEQTLWLHTCWLKKENYILAGHLYDTL